jgi:hypothetical protein
VTFRFDIVSPAAITVLPDVSALQTFPTGGISVSDNTGNTIAVTIVAANSGAGFSASSADGATISSDANTITITGSQAQVNAALASLTISETAGPAEDIITVTAIDTADLITRTAIAVNIGATTGPAFAAPPATIALNAYSLSTISGLVLGDPQAAALAEAGLGASEALAITLSVASGILLLPSLSSFGGIEAAGNGTNEILLTFSADQLAAVNALLATLEYAAPAATSGLAYAMRNVAGPLGGASTSGNITLDITGAQGPTSTVTTGGATAILGVSTLAGTLAVSNTTSDLGGIYGAGAISISPGAAVALPYSTLSLGGTSFDFGKLDAAAMNELGTLFIADGAVTGGLLALGTAGFIDFSGTLTAGAEAPNTTQQAITLAAGALITGGGTLIAGNFSESALISGPGTILAGPGETLLIAAEAVTATTLDIAAGGVMVLGPLDPLYGVFDATPLTIAPNVTLAFLDNSGAIPVTGGFADSLAQPGGVIVMDSPDVFAGTIIGFAPGDRVIFPGLTGLTVETQTSRGFAVLGVEGTTSISYTFAAAIPVGTTLFVGTDDEGDGEISLGATINPPAEVFIGGVTAAADVIAADAGAAQAVLGIDILLRSWTTQSLTLTLSVGHGILSDANYPLTSTLTLTAASPAALDATLATVFYTASSGFAADDLTISSETGLLSGLDDITAIRISTIGGTVSGFGNAGQTAWFAGAGPPLTTAAAPGEILVTGTADFADRLYAIGLSGTSMLVDDGGCAIFDAGADAVFGNEITIGNNAGGGWLDIVTDDFFSGRDVTIGGGAAASGAIISGIATVAGTIMAGESGAAVIDLTGGLGAAAVMIGAAGSFTATGTAGAGFETMINAGTVQFLDQSTLTLTELINTGTFMAGGTARLAPQFVTLQAGMLAIGPDAAITAPQITQSGGTLALSGTLSAGTPLPDSGVIDLSGGTIIAPALSLSAATLSGYGYIEGTAGLGTIFLSGGTILASGAMGLGGDVSLANGAGIGIASGGSLDIVHGLSGGTISFSGGSAELTFNDLAVVTAAITGMLDHDAIDLIGIAPSLVAFSAGSISAGTLGGFSLAVAGGQPGLQIGADGFGGTLITLGGDMACFCAGTRLLTPNGYRPVEAFAPDDPVVTLDGAVRAVRWIGRRTLDLADEPRARPVRFAAGALGGNVPTKPVLLSPLHAVFIDGVLVPAMHLVNGATITQTHRAAATYYHLELDRHDILLAEGMGAESYLDTGNRGGLYHEQGRRGNCRTACAALVTNGPQLADIRRKLHKVALAAGYTLTYDPALRGVAARQSILPRMTRKSGRRVARFRLPRGAECLHLAANAATPADTDPDSEDRREIAICLDEAGDAAFGAGWLPRAAGDSGLWMGSSGEILITRERFDITLGITAVVRTWRLPLARSQ